MTQAFEIAGTGLSAQQRALDIIANNIANLNTPAFKRSDVRFRELIAQGSASQGPAGSRRPEGRVASVAVQAQVAFDAQGPIEPTGRALDMAINGPGFIELMGPGGQVLLWRGGRLAIADDGQLINESGLALRAMITVPLDASELRIGTDGTVTAINSLGETEGLGQIGLVRIDDFSALERMDGGVYRLSEGARLRDSVPGEDGSGQLVQGAVERSNVDLNEEMVRLMVIQRAYAANAQIVQAADQLMSIANSLRQ